MCLLFCLFVCKTMLAWNHFLDVVLGVIPKIYQLGNGARDSRLLVATKWLIAQFLLNCLQIYLSKT